MTIGDLARAAEVGVETVRFYERQGLIEKPPRLESGYRIYSAEAVDRVRFIRRAKKLGFVLKEIKELLALRLAPGTTCDRIKKRAESKIEDIDFRIRGLQGMKVALEALTDACVGQRLQGDRRLRRQRLSGGLPYS